MADYATVAEAKAHPALEGVSATDARIDEVLTAVEQRIESRLATSVAWVPRTATESLIGDGTQTLFVEHIRCRSLTSVSDDGDAIADLTDWRLHPSGVLIRPTGTFTTNHVYEVVYDHGYDAPPEDLVEAALLATATLLHHSDNPRVGERTEQIDYGGGPTVMFAAVADAKRGRPFGMPAVDTVVMSHSHQRPSVG